MPDGAPPTLPSVDYTLAHVQYNMRWALRGTDEDVREIGMTPQQHEVLLVVAGAPVERPLTLAEISERLQISGRAAFWLVDQMTASGLLAREKDPKDRRRILISLTPAAGELLKRLEAFHRIEIEEIRPALRDLCAILKRVA